MVMLVRLCSGGVLVVLVPVRLALGCDLGGAVKLLGHMVLLGRHQLLGDL